MPQVSRKVARGMVVDIRGKTSTLDYDPIKVWKDSSVDYFFCAEWSIRQLQSVRNLQSQRQRGVASLQVGVESSDTVLLNVWSPAPRTATLQNEADVSHASSGVLVDLVSLLLQTLVPKLEIRHRYESQVNDSKTDLLWMYKRPDAADGDDGEADGDDGEDDGDDGEDDQCWEEFAILEYKKTNVIHRQQFARGRLGAVKNKGVPLSQEQLLSVAAKQELGTLLTDNAVTLTQQVVKYSDRAKHIMLFDWDTMAVFEFTEANPEMAEIFFFQEDEVPESSGKTFKTLLLGFLQHSLEDKLKDNGLSFTDLLVLLKWMIVRAHVLTVTQVCTQQPFNPPRIESRRRVPDTVYSNLGLSHLITDERLNTWDERPSKDAAAPVSVAWCRRECDRSLGVIVEGC